MNIKAEENNSVRQNSAKLSESSTPPEDPTKEYENMLQKLEEEARNHIRVEQQLKLHVEALQTKVDDLEKELSDMTKKMKKEQSENAKLSKNLNSEKQKTHEIGEKYEKLKIKFSKLIEPGSTSSKESLQNCEIIEKSEIIKPTKTELSSLIKSIHAPKGVGIKEQNIYQIICNNNNSSTNHSQSLMASKSPELGISKSPNIVQIVSQKLEGKEHEIQKLKHQLSKLQSEIKIQRSVSREGSMRMKKYIEKEGNYSTGHTRSKSQSIFLMNYAYF